MVDTVHTEERQMTQLVVDLAAEFPDVPFEVIEGLARQANERYETATVRAFLTILVTKDVRAKLRAAAYTSDVPMQMRPTGAELLMPELTAGRSV